MQPRVQRPDDGTPSELLDKASSGRARRGMKRFYGLHETLLWVHEISPSPWTMNWQRVPRSGRRKREQKALERNFDRFRFRVRKRTWKRGSLCPVLIFLAQMFLFYAYDASDRAKQRIAQSLVRRAIAAEMVTSTQALAEFAATLLQKLSPAARPAARPADVAAILDIPKK